MVGFIDLTPPTNARDDFHCRSLVGIRAAMANGQQLMLTHADCAPGEFEERFVIPEGLATDDLNISFDDGQRSSRVVLPNVLRPLQIQNDAVFLAADKNSVVDLGLMPGEYVFDLTVGFSDEAGKQLWRTTNEDFSRRIVAGPGAPPLRGSWCSPDR